MPETKKKRSLFAPDTRRVWTVHSVGHSVYLDRFENQSSENFG